MRLESAKSVRWGNHEARIDAPLDLRRYFGGRRPYGVAGHGCPSRECEHRAVRTLIQPDAFAESAVAACGQQTFPLRSTTPLEGGGFEYDYNINGHEIRFRVPPSNFDPRTASASALREYFIPSRPAAPSQLTA